MTTPSPDLFAALQAVLEPQYRLERELGRGGMGIVFLATDTTLDRRVAIKAVHPELAAHQSIGRRFLAEARTIARLRHPNIVAVHTAGNADGLLFYVMDEVEGESLRQRLVREQRLDPATVARIVGDLAAALDAAGRAGVVHRDVKPENVLLDQATGRAMLADFGIARAMAAETGTSSTGQGVAVGTPAYMSPEQAAGEEIDGRSDLYALGVVAYEMLAGAPPFRGPNRVVVSKHIAERPAPIERLRPDTPRPLAAAIMRALEKQPADRWQTGEAFRQATGDRAAGGAARAPAAARAGRRGDRRRAGERARSGSPAGRRDPRAASTRGTRFWSCRSTTCGTTGPSTGCAMAASACWDSTCRSGTTSRSSTTSGFTTSWPPTSSAPATTSGSTSRGGWPGRPASGPWCSATTPRRATRST